MSTTTTTTANAELDRIPAASFRNRHRPAGVDFTREYHRNEMGDDSQTPLYTSTSLPDNEASNPPHGISEAIALAIGDFYVRDEPGGYDTEGEIWSYWELPAALQAAFKPDTQIKSIFTFTQTGSAFQGLDYGSYIHKCWPLTGLAVLDCVQKYLDFRNASSWSQQSASCSRWSIYMLE